MEIKIQIDNYPFSENIQDQIFGLEKEVFGRVRTKKWKRIVEYEDVWMVSASVDDKLVGMKIGFKANAKTFYSWIGGVLPDYREKGIARMLMDKQHQVAKEKGYDLVQTKTYNKWKSMLILNLKCGFDIVTATKKSNGDSKILLQKSLK